MATERFIENNVIRNRHLLGYTDSLFIRRCRAGRRFGVVDVMIFPLRGPHRVVLVEAKQSASLEASGRVIGQLLLYYAGALQLGAHGVRLMRDFASAHAVHARSTKPKSLKMLSGGISPPDAVWKELQKGRKSQLGQIGLFVALDGEPPDGLLSALSTLRSHHNLDIGVVSVLGKDKLELWQPA